MPNGRQHASKPIVIVYDVVSEAMTLDLLCRSMGVETICTVSAAQTDAVLVRIRPAGIIADLLRPGPGGLDWLSMIAERSPGIPIMGVFASEPLRLQGAAELGGKHGFGDLMCVAKPVEISTVRAFVVRTGCLLRPSQWDLH